MESGHKNGVQRPSARKRSRSGDGRTAWVVYALIGILLFALVTDLLFYTGYIASDDIQYLGGAVEIARTSKLTYITFGTIRLGIVLPLALMIRLVHGDLSVAIASLLVFHLLLIAGVYWLGLVVHDAWTGLLAAGLMAVCPLAAGLATMALPDHPMTAFLVLATAAVLAACRAVPGSRKSSLLFAAGGVFYAVALTMKEAGIVLLPPLVAVMVSILPRAGARKALTALLLFFSAAAMVGALYAVAFHATSGFWFPTQHPVLAERWGNAQGNSWSSLERLQKLAGFWSNDLYLGVLSWAILVSLVAYPLTRRRSWVLYLTLLWVCAYTTWGTFSLKHYVAPPMLVRYTIFPLSFAVIIVAYVARMLAAIPWRRLRYHRASRRLMIALGVLACIGMVANSYVRLNRIAGRFVFAPEVSATRYALTAAVTSKQTPVVLSSWLSIRLKPSLAYMSPDTVILTDLKASVTDVLRAAGRDRFFYVDSEREGEPGRPYPKSGSPFDEAMREAAEEQSGNIEVRTLGQFRQFYTRLAAARWLYAGSAQPVGAPTRGRSVYLREVRVVQQEAMHLDEAEAVELDLRKPGIYAPTWVTRVRDCNVSLEDGEIRCEVVGGEATRGGQYGGVMLRVGQVQALRIDVTFDDPEQIAAAYLDLTVGADPNNRIRWQASLPEGSSLPSGRTTYVFRPGLRSGSFTYSGGAGDPAEVNHAQLFLKLKGLNAQAGFRIHEVWVER